MIVIFTLNYSNAPSELLPSSVSFSLSPLLYFPINFQFLPHSPFSLPPSPLCSCAPSRLAYFSPSPSPPSSLFLFLCFFFFFLSFLSPSLSILFYIFVIFFYPSFLLPFFTFSFHPHLGHFFPFPFSTVVFFAFSTSSNMFSRCIVPIPII